MAGFMIEDLESGKVRQFHWNEVEDLPCDGNATLLDVRTEGEYRRGHLNGFRNIPLDDLREHLDELERGKSVYVNCQTGLCSKNSVNATSVTKSEISRFRSRRPLPPDPYCSAPTQPPPLAAAWPWQVIGKNAKLNRRRDTFVSEISEFRHRRRD